MANRFFSLRAILIFLISILLLLGIPTLLLSRDIQTSAGVWLFNKGFDSAAYHLFRLPVAFNYPPAQNHMAVLHFDGLGAASRDRQKTIWYLEKASAEGYAPAKANLGFLYWHGVNNRLKRDWEKTLSLYQSAADQGDLFGLFRLTSFIMRTEGRGRYQKAVPYLRQAAQSGDPEALHEFALHMHHICSDEPDEFACHYERVLALRKAAELNHAAAQHMLARLMQFFSKTPEMISLGLSYDPKEVLRLYHRSAESGYLNSHWEIADAYFSGEGVARDRRLSAKWYEKIVAYQKPKQVDAVPRGYGVLYLRPILGGRRDVLRTAATAHYHLGEIYSEGLDIEADFERAAGHYKHSAEAGIHRAQIELAKLYMSGQGVAQSREEARYWLSQAVRGGSEEAAQFLLEIEEE